MARPREFDPDTAVAAAMQVFWLNGYEDTSLPDLLAGTGLSRGSLYKAFTGKQALFIAALQTYATQEVWPAVALLRERKDLSGFDRISQVFQTIPTAVRAGDDRGCLLCSAAAGRAAQEPDIAVIIKDLLAALEGGFDVALAAHDINIAGLAHMLLAQYIGLRTLQKSGVDAESIGGNVDALLALLAHET